ncbi:MAG: hypothetical protein M1829_002929 [Trizodia sp. TS-e1964]|nr:MAG: hypothetical protein M1829_002929 [Trizodia sp. TS-e1964]
MPQNIHQPPAGPLHQQEEYSSPAGPPTSHQEQFAPPPGPLPSHQQYAAPPGPPPNQLDPAANNAWTVIPDTSLLPPPPAFGRDRGAVSNAPEAQANRAIAYCRQNPLWAPRTLQPNELQRLEASEIQLIKPPELSGDLTARHAGCWGVRTRNGSADACILTYSPLYSVQAHSPLLTECPATIYFEVRILSLGRGEGGDPSSLGIGYCAQPYPTWRLPGWERGSLGVHGDDGCKYINDKWGGKQFTAPFKTGERVGIGMVISTPTALPDYAATKQPLRMPCKVEVFFTRNGKKDGSWDLHEDRDAKGDLGIEGLEGQFDLYAGVGCFGGMEVEVYFARADWLFKP